MEINVINNENLNKGNSLHIHFSIKKKLFKENFYRILIIHNIFMDLVKIV